MPNQTGAFDPPSSKQPGCPVLAAGTLAHAANEWAGVEFIQERWYSDVALDHIFWHDHVDGIHGWGHGLVGMLNIEPAGSTYHDPKTGAMTDGAGTQADIYTSAGTPNHQLIPGAVDTSLREWSAFTMDANPVTDSTINLTAEPWANRAGDPSLRYSSYAHGDPFTPIPKAYAGDPFVIRTINISQRIDALHLDPTTYNNGEVPPGSANPSARPSTRSITASPNATPSLWTAAPEACSTSQATISLQHYARQTYPRRGVG